MTVLQDSSHRPAEGGHSGQREQQAHDQRADENPCQAAHGGSIGRPEVGR